MTYNIARKIYYVCEALNEVDQTLSSEIREQYEKLQFKQLDQQTLEDLKRFDQRLDQMISKHQLKISYY